MSDIGEWFTSIPFLTKWWLSLTVVFSLSAKIGLFDPYTLILLSKAVLQGFQIWRPFTALFYYPTGFPFLVNCYFLYSYSLRLETGQYVGRPADYFFLLVFNWMCCVVIALLIDMIILMDSMVLSVLYVWCQLNKDTIVSFWFGTRFKAMYLPFVLCAFNMVIGGGGLKELVGIVVGHIYFFLMFKYPQELGGQQLISTPSVFYQWFPNERVTGGFGAAPFRRGGGDQPQEGGGPRTHQWGRGFTLGND